MYGLAGKILRINLTTQDVTTLDTEDYREWVGGHGLATALWFDFVKDKTISAFDPGNALVVAPGLFSGTLIPAACRTEMVGIQAQSYPYEWFTRSNVGGRFANMLKYAGFDAIVLEGAADKPTWIDIVDGDVELKDASGLWGLDTYQTQAVVFSELTGGKGFGDWLETKRGKRTTQRPAVLCIGPAGENKSRIATVQTDAGNAFGQGGFGGIWGAKNLKALSVLGTGSVDVADPKAVLEARLWAERHYATDFDNPYTYSWLAPITSHFGGHRYKAAKEYKQIGLSGCYGCHLNCQTRTPTGIGNDSVCVANYYTDWDKEAHGKYTPASGVAADLAQRLGVNTFAVSRGLSYLKELYARGILGKGKEIDTDLPFDKVGGAVFIKEYLNRIAYRHEIGDDLAEGFNRAAERWGRLEEDLETGIPINMNWGYPAHYDARTEVYWGYATILSARDVNCHDFNLAAHWIGPEDTVVSAGQIAEWIGEVGPYRDPEMLNFADDNIYSVHMARTTAWLLHYSRFWKQSCGLCDNCFADFINPNGPNNRGLTPEGELKFYKAVTGQSLSFEESMEIGRKMYNLDKAIWTLQGRHRDMEVFPEYIYSVDSESADMLPCKVDGKWDYVKVAPRHLDRDKVEDLKTTFYELEGWDPQTGWQTRATLERLGLNQVADELAVAGKLP